MNWKLRYSILAADLLWITSAYMGTHLLWSLLTVRGADLLQFADIPVILIASSIWTVLYIRKELEGFRGGWYFPTVFTQVVVGIFYLMCSLLVMAIVSSYHYSWLALFYFAFLLSLGFITIRCLAWWLVASQFSMRAKRRAVILGSGRIAHELALKISRHPELLMEVAGVLFPSGTESSGQASTLRSDTISVRTLNVLNLMERKQIQELIVVEPIPPGPEPLKLISKCRKIGMQVHLVPQHYELYLSKARLTEIDDVPLLSLEQQTVPLLGLELKRAMDLLGAAILFTASFPLLTLSAVILYLNKKQAFREELRCGKNGHQFCMYRLNIDRDAADLTVLERILAQFSLTELPQLWNVFRGEMSLVGPRPESPERVKHYSMWQRQRLSVRPGITGLAQVHGLREKHSSEEKARFDLQYIFHWSLFQDISLLLQTGWTFFVRLIEEDGFRVTSNLKPVNGAGLFSARAFHADRSQSGAD